VHEVDSTARNETTQVLLDNQVRHIVTSSTRVLSAGTTPCPSGGNYIVCQISMAGPNPEVGRDEGIPLSQICVK